MITLGIDSLQLVSKPLSAAIGCKARGSAFSAKRVLNVLQHASEPFSPRALTTGFSLDLLRLVLPDVAPGPYRVATKQVLKPLRPVEIADIPIHGLFKAVTD